MGVLTTLHAAFTLDLKNLESMYKGHGNFLVAYVFPVRHDFRRATKMFLQGSQGQYSRVFTLPISVN